MGRRTFIPQSILKWKKISDYFFFRPFFKKVRISYEVIFSNTAHYCTSTTNKINDLFGFKFGLLKPTEAAFAWRPCEVGFEIFAYSKQGGQKTTYFLAHILPNHSYNLTIKKHKEYFSYSIFTDAGILISYYKISRMKCPSFGKEIFVSIESKAGVLSNIAILLKRKY